MTTLSQQSAQSLRNAIAQAANGLVEREALVEMVALAAVAGEHLLVIGPPGTAKSEAVRRVARTMGGQYFEYLLGRFTEPSEIFGPVDLRKLKEGIVETETAGMLPEAEIAFLDEVFLGSSAILNTLLGLLNERVFRRGHSNFPVPLRVCVGASNALPSDESLAAFADRFLVHVYIDSIPDPRLEELLEGGWQLARAPLTPQGTLADLDALSRAAREVDMGQVRPFLAHAIRLLRGAGITLSDRRAVKVQRLIAAATILDGRTVATEADLWPLVLAVPSNDGQQIARDTLRDLLSRTQNATLTAASEEASLGPLARATRIVAAGRALLTTGPEMGDGAGESWRLKLEGIAREIDAGFAPESLPMELAEVRAEIIEAIAGPSSDAETVS